MGPRLSRGFPGDRAVLKNAIRTAAAVLALLGASHAPATAATTTYRGVWALASPPEGGSATLRLERTSALSANLDITEESHGALVRDYALDMTKRMHLIVIDDDFTTFAHEHPVLGSDGHLRLALTVPKAGRYLIYADATPANAGQAVFRFTVPFGAAPQATNAAGTHPTGRTVTAGPYRVTLGAVRFPAATTSTLAVTIAKSGKPATDLRPYLGGAAHAVFIDTATLAYLHVHPTTGSHDDPPMASGAMAGMPGMDDLSPNAHVPAAMTLHVGTLDPGRYKLWLQFRGETLEVAPFTIDATR